MEIFSSFLLEGQLVFGKYPTDEETTLIESCGYSLFVDLCPLEEITWTPYVLKTSLRHHLPIPDRKPQGNPKDYTETIDIILGALQNNEKVYIHCRGGHGRSGTLAAIIYGRVTNSSGFEALEAVKRAHQNRLEMSDKMRKLGAPQTRVQKTFVLKNLPTPVLTKD